jgi:chromosome segregation ATPase
MKSKSNRRLASSALAAVVCLQQGAPSPAPSLEETRLAMGKWIETEQILSKERKDWQQVKEILVGRLELLHQEVATVEKKITEAEGGVAAANAKRDELTAQNELLRSAESQLAGAVTGMESEVRRLIGSLPDPVRTKLKPLVQRIPEDPAKTRASVSERFQNVLGILNEVNKATGELNVVYEVRDLADGKPAEVQSIYVGLAQAYYVSSGGQSGIGRPTPDGWKWEPSNALAGDVLLALEVLQGKHSPTFVPLPVKLQ